MPELTDSNELRQRIIEEARSRIPVPPALDEITSNGLADEIGISLAQAKALLTNMVEEGIATKRDNGIENDKPCKVYKFTNLVRESE